MELELSFPEWYSCLHRGNQKGRAINTTNHTGCVRLWITHSRVVQTTFDYHILIIGVELYGIKILLADHIDKKGG